ncbi:hypothetical protein LJC56_10295 [Christensenellaceae bacterium OttesenSCG-928-K19]|nr:hypothetical protein [Christensenellaceae bacterium OttesenSCG-928-K19]
MATSSIVNATMELTCLLITASLHVSMFISKTNKTTLTRILLGMLIVNCIILLNDTIAWWFADRSAPFVHPLLVSANFLAFIGSLLLPILSNVPSRLLALCGDWLTVKRIPGEGTVATIEILKKGVISHEHNSRR